MLLRLHDFLKEIQADEVPHSGRSLMNHLLGTYGILKKWDCEEFVCLAGGLHSIYGTNVFKRESLSIEARPRVRHLFGEDAERLAWQFGTINRPKAIEIGFGIDRRRNTEIILKEPDLKSLRLIEAANLLEQGASLDSWPNILKIATENTSKFHQSEI